jgi:hypothetical protein
MSDGSAGLLVTVDDEEGRLLTRGARREIRAKVRVEPDSYLDLMVVDTGEWRLIEVSADGRAAPRILAKGRLPTSQYVDERDWDGH